MSTTSSPSLSPSMDKHDVLKNEISEQRKSLKRAMEKLDREEEMVEKLRMKKEKAQQLYECSVRELEKTVSKAKAVLKHLKITDPSLPTFSNKGKKKVGEYYGNKEVNGICNSGVAKVDQRKKPRVIASVPMVDPSFYKVLMDLPSQLGLPRGFTDKYSAILPHNAKLRIASGAAWEVSVEKKLEEEEDKDKDCYFFTKGWTEFLQEMELQRFQLLVFSYAGDSTFRVTVYGDDSYEKESNFRIRRNDPHPRFQTTMKGYNKYRIHLPQHFHLAAGLKEGEKVVVVEYPAHGKSAEVWLKGTTCRVNSVMNLGVGWVEFWRKCNMSVGKTYSFEFLPTRKVILVKLLKSDELTS